MPLSSLLRASAIALALSAVALPSAASAATPDGVIVRYRTGATAADRLDARRDAAVTRDEGLPLARTEVDQPAPGTSVADAVDRLNGDPAVDYAEPNRRIHAFLAPNDNLFASQWALQNSAQSITGATALPSPIAGADIHAPAAWDLTTGDPHVVVGVVDTGVDATHPDLAANIWTNPREVPGNGVDDDDNGEVDDVHGWDFVDGDNAPSDLTSAANPGHGTHVSGTIAARGNDGPGGNSGVAGVTWSSTIMPVRVLDQTGSGTLADVVAGYAYAARDGARIINASLGDFSPSQTERATIAAFPDTLFVVAAGNDAANTDAGDQATCASIVNAPGFDPAKPPLQCSFPCDYGLANIVCVAASDRADQLASFSNFGSRFVDLAAPGTTIWSTIPGGWRSLSGTSMATPHVAGVAALALARDPALTSAQLRQALVDGVDRRDGLAGKVASGGRLSATGTLAAVDAIAAAPPPAPPAPSSPAPSAPPAAASRVPAPDRAAPALSLGFPVRGRTATVSRRGLQARVRCSEACSVTLTLVLDAATARRLHRSRTVTRLTLRLGAGRRVVRTLRLPRALTVGRRRLRLTLRARAADAAGNATRRTAAVVLSR